MPALHIIARLHAFPEHHIIASVKSTVQKSSESTLRAGFHSRGVLPHIKKEGASYFVTFRLAGTLPKEVLIRFKAERQAILADALAGRRPLTWQEQEELFRWYSARVDKYLDAGHGDCWLASPEIASLAANTLQHHANKRFILHAWVVMPNYVHAVLRPLPDWTLTKILKSWKGFSAREINRKLKLTGKPLWQTESYDHLIRDEEDLQRSCHYTINNPVHARLCKQPEDWKWSSAYRATQ